MCKLSARSYRAMDFSVDVRSIRHKELHLLRLTVKRELTCNEFITVGRQVVRKKMNTSVSSSVMKSEGEGRGGVEEEEEEGGGGGSNAGSL